MAVKVQSLTGFLNRAVADVAQCSDRELLERFTASADEAAFAAIVDRHGPMLRGICQRMLDDASLADDVLQATFVVLARKAGSIRRRESLAGWLVGVAQRIGRKARLSEAARTRREKRVAASHVEAHVEPSWNELLRVLDEELAQLMDRHRAALLLCYLEGRTQDEAAKLLGCSLSTFRRHLDHGRKLLRERMIRRGATLGAGLFATFLAPSACCALTPELAQAIRATATIQANGNLLPASVAVLANGGIHMLNGAARLYSCVAIAGVIGGIIMAAVWNFGAPIRAKEAIDRNQPLHVANNDARNSLNEPPKEPAVLRDQFNSPLPKGAMARLGAIDFRHGRINYGASLTFSPDGKHLVSTGGGWVRRWDVATGDAIVNIGDGWRTNQGIDTISPDGKRARTSGSEPSPRGGLIWVWTDYDLETGKQLQFGKIEFPSNTSDGHALPGLRSPDSKTYAEINYGGKLTLWDGDGKFTHHVVPAQGKFIALDFTPDSRFAVIGDDSHCFHVFDLASGKLQRSFGQQGSAIVRVAISPDGKSLIAASAKAGSNVPPSWPHDRWLEIWNLKDGTRAKRLDFSDEGSVPTLLFSPDNRIAIAGIRGKLGPVVRTWDVESGKPGPVVGEGDRAIGLTLAVSPDGKTLATMNDDGVIRLWDLRTGKEKNPIAASPCGLEAVCFRPDGNTLLTVGADQRIRDWDAETGKLLAKRGSVNGQQPTFVAGGARLMTFAPVGEKDRAVRLIDPVTEKLVIEQSASVAVVSADGHRMALWNRGQAVRVLNVDNGKTIQTLQMPAQNAKWNHSPIPRAFTADGKSLILQAESISVWDVDTGKQKSEWSLLKNKVLDKPPFQDHNISDRIESIAVSGDGTKIAIVVLKSPPDRRSHFDLFSRIMLFETATGKLLYQIDMNEVGVKPIAFSPDDKRLAAAGAWTVRVWDVASGQEILNRDSHRGEIKSIAFSPDGKRLATASRDSTVLVWQLPD